MAFLWGGICSLLVLALITGTRRQEIWWMAAWVAATTSLGWGIFGRSRAQKMKSALPFPDGIYVFATDVIIAEDGRCLLHPFDTLTHAKMGSVTGASGIQQAQIKWQFPGETVSLIVASQQIAQRLLGQIQIAHDRLAEAMSVGDSETVLALDPLYGARHGGAWEQVCPPVVVSGARGASGWFGLPVPVVRSGLIAGVVAGVAIWFGSNQVRDGIAFRLALSTNTPGAWRQFLKRPDSTYHTDVKRRRLPAAALRAAQKDGGAEALRQVANEFGNSQAGAEAAAALERIYDDSETNSLAEMDPQAHPAVKGFFRWLREHRTADLEVRFGESSQALLTTIDEYLKDRLRLDRLPIEIAQSAASFSPAVVNRREDAVVSVLREGLRNVVSSEVVSLAKGRAFSGSPRGFDKPALTIQATVEPVNGVIADTARERAYLMLGFNFHVEITTPGGPAWSFDLPVNPAEFLDASQGGSLYDRMADIAYQELHQKIAETFFRHHVPQRTIKLTRTRPASAPASPRTPRFSLSATGFFISSQGYLVTAAHFTNRARNIQVTTEFGRLAARLVREDRANDLALLKVEGSFKALPIRPSETAKLLDKVATYGFPQIDIQGRELKANEGTISGLKGAKDDASMFQFSSPVQHGNSGGPLLDESGNVIGVVVGMLDPSAAQNVNYAVKSTELLKFLATIPELTTLPPVLTGSSPEMREIIPKATVLLEAEEN